MTSKEEMLENHYRIENERAMVGLKYELKMYFEHDLQEIRLCLCRENPNIEMAMSRVENMQCWLNEHC